MTKGYKTGGRKKGTPNKHTAEVKELAQQHGVECVERLAEIAGGDNVPAAVAACRELLDRGYGKAIASVVVASDEPSLLDVFKAIDERDAERKSKREAAKNEGDAGPPEPNPDVVH